MKKIFGFLKVMMVIYALPSFAGELYTPSEIDAKLNSNPYAVGSFVAAKTVSCVIAGGEIARTYDQNQEIFLASPYKVNNGWILTSSNCYIYPLKTDFKIVFKTSPTRFCPDGSIPPCKHHL